MSGRPRAGRLAAVNGDGSVRVDPFAREPDRLLAGLRERCGPDPYRLIPSAGVGGLDAWRARCPLHPGSEGAGWSRYSLLVAELPGGRAEVCCVVGCPAWAVRLALLRDPEFERATGAAARVLLWRQSYRSRGAA